MHLRRVDVRALGVRERALGVAAGLEDGGHVATRGRVRRTELEVMNPQAGRAKDEVAIQKSAVDAHPMDGLAVRPAVEVEEEEGQVAVEGLRVEQHELDPVERPLDKLLSEGGDEVVVPGA